MVTGFRFPDVGEGITEGLIKKWHVKEGDAVKEDQVLAEVETDKAIVEMPSPVAGTVLRIMVPEDATVRVGQVMVALGSPGEPVPDVFPVGAGPAVTVATAPAATAAAASTAVAAPSARVQSTPKVRKLAQELGVDIATVAGTGPGGRVTEEDVQRAAKPATATPPPPPQPKPSAVKLNYDFYGHIDHRPFKGLRKTIADKLSESFYTAPHATAMEEVDATELWQLRERLKGQAGEHGLRGLTFLPLIAMAVVKALLKHPTLNAELDAENEDIVVKRYVNLGIAVDTPEGLMVPNVKRAEQKDVWTIAREIDDLTTKARSRKVDLADLRGGSFTITNYGSVGGMFGVPIINPPEAAILGVGRIREVPRVKDGQIVVRKVVGLSVSFDHRVVDGAEVAAFINTLKGLLEDPSQLTG